MIEGAVLLAIDIDLARAFAAPSLPSRVFLLAASLRRIATQVAQLRHRLGAIKDLDTLLIIIELHLRVLIGKVGVVRIEYLLEYLESPMVALEVAVKYRINLVDEGFLVAGELPPVQRIDLPIWPLLSK